MRGEELLGVFNGGMNVDEFAHLLADGLVEIDEKVVFLLEERTDVVSIVLEERALAIG